MQFYRDPYRYPAFRSPSFGLLRNDETAFWNRLFNELNSATPKTSRTFPALNVSESVEGFEVECELPGVELKDLDITVHGDHLSISGERKPNELEGNVLRRERPTGKF